MVGARLEALVRFLELRGGASVLVCAGPRGPLPSLWTGRSGIVDGPENGPEPWPPGPWGAKIDRLDDGDDRFPRSLVQLG